MKAGQRVCAYNGSILGADPNDLGTVVMDTRSPGSRERGFKGRIPVVIWDISEPGYPLDIDTAMVLDGDPDHRANAVLVDTPPEDYRRNAIDAWRRFHRSMRKFGGAK